MNNRQSLPTWAWEDSLRSRSVNGCRMTADAPILIPGVKRSSLSAGEVDLSLCPGKKARTTQGRTTHPTAAPLTRAEKRKARKERKRSA